MRIRIGAMTRHVQIEESSLIGERLPILREAASEIGDAQVRNRGTIGGGLVEGRSCGDYGAVVLALDAQMKCASPRGERIIPADEFFTFAYTTTMEPDEILTEIVFPAAGIKAARAFIMKLEKVAGDFAIASAAVQLSLDANGASVMKSASVSPAAHSCRKRDRRLKLCCAGRKLLPAVDRASRPT